MSLISHLFVLLEAMTREDIEALVPAERQRLANTLAHWAKIAEQTGQPKPTGGVLGSLKSESRED